MDGCGDGVIMLMVGSRKHDFTFVNGFFQISRWLELSTIFRTTKRFTALSFGTARPLTSQRTNRQDPRPLRFLPLFLRFLVIKKPCCARKNKLAGWQ